MKAKHSNAAIDALYTARRKAADDSNESGLRGMRGWRHLEEIEDVLRDIDPDGDWMREACTPDTNWEWTVTA